MFNNSTKREETHFPEPMVRKINENPTKTARNNEVVARLFIPFVSFYFHL